MTIPACEDLVVHKLIAKIEIPAFHAVYNVDALSIERVGSIIARAPVDLSKVEAITYDGQNVTVDMSLEDIYFRNGSAFVIYPDEPCPSHTPSPSNSPSPFPSPSQTPSMSAYPSPSSSPLPIKKKVRKLGAYDAYRHCKNARGEKIQLPNPDSLGLDAQAVDPTGRASNSSIICEDSAGNEHEVVDDSDLGNVRGPEESPAPKTNYTAPRPAMARSANINVRFEHRNIPVVINPLARGIDIFDAVTIATGRPHKYLVGQFKDREIDHYTRLKPFGFVDGDLVVVKDRVVDQGVTENGMPPSQEEIQFGQDEHESA